MTQAPTDARGELPEAQTTFWRIIDSVQGVSDLEDRVDAIQDRINEMDLEELTRYQRGYVDAHRQIYTWKHWGAAEAFMGYVSDDVFFDLRGWVMLHGSAKYREFLLDPDTLGDFGLRDGDGVSDGELLDYVSHDRFKALGGVDIDESDDLNVYAVLDEPHGAKLPDGVAVRELFPRNARAGEGQAWFLPPVGF